MGKTTGKKIYGTCAHCGSILEVEGVEGAKFFVPNHVKDTDALKQKVEAVGDTLLETLDELAKVSGTLSATEEIIEKIQEAALYVINKHELLHPQCGRDDCLIHDLKQACTDKKGSHDRHKLHK
jgi:hypothetical protein